MKAAYELNFTIDFVNPSKGQISATHLWLDFPRPVDEWSAIDVESLADRLVLQMKALNDPGPFAWYLAQLGNQWTLYVEGATTRTSPVLILRHEQLPDDPTRRRAA